MSDKDGGQAFLIRSHYSTPGMSLRDWFAGQALASLDFFGSNPRVDEAPVVAEEAYRIADAMLKEREKCRGGASQ